MRVLMTIKFYRCDEVDADLHAAASASKPSESRDTLAAIEVCHRSSALSCSSRDTSANTRIDLTVYTPPSGQKIAS
jgi:hypothetical protein